MDNPQAWWQEGWDAFVTHAYQQAGFLTRGMTTPPRAVQGKKLHFPIAGKGVAQDYAPGDKVKLMNASRGEVTLEASEWDAADYIYQYQTDRMASSTMELDSVRHAAAAALGRKHDEVLYSKLQGTDFNALGQVSGAFANAFGVGEFMKARRALFERDVPFENGMNFCGLPPIVFDTFMSFETFSNSQYVGPNLPFADGTRRRSWQNVHFFELPLHLQSKSSTDGKFYMWNISALGTGYTGEQIRTSFKDELTDWKRWLYRSTLSGGACLILPEGIQECRYKTDTEPTFT